MKPKRQKAVEWTAYGVNGGTPFMITVGVKTRREAIEFIEKTTGVPIVMKEEVKRCAVMPAEWAPESLKTIDWNAE